MYGWIYNLCDYSINKTIINVFFALNLKIYKILQFTIQSYDLRSHLSSTILRKIPILTTLVLTLFWKNTDITRLTLDETIYWMANIIHSHPVWLAKKNHSHPVFLSQFPHLLLQFFFALQFSEVTTELQNPSLFIYFFLRSFPSLEGSGGALWF